ncbi:MAG: cytochrome c biogenesis protein ResB [Sedimentisphaerales bacterium]|nr:cytochrome c biogenesis protein ResB [Sedimentisphaerales bacterium]
MTKIKRIVMWMTLLAILLLIVLSIIGAFCGAQKAKSIFNSIPVAVYWFILAVLLVAGLFMFRRLLHNPGLLTIHAGCLLVLIGGLWGSQAGHKLAEQLLGIQKTPSGYMAVFEQDTEKHITNEDLEIPIAELPFGILLKDFRVEYYDADENFIPKLNIITRKNQFFQVAAKAGQEISLGPDYGRLKIIRTFKNFKISVKDDKRIITDEGPGAENPAVEVEIQTPDGAAYKDYAFERFAGFSHTKNDLQLNYISQPPRIVRDYYSDVVIIEDGKEVLSKTIEVNHPLHYRGYHFYQHSYDSQAGRYTILSVTSDSGLYTVYAGYWLLTFGVLWNFWLRHIKGKKPGEVTI